MSRIKSKTKFEEDFLKKLSPVVYPAGYRYRKHYLKLPGKPDVVFVKQRLVVFLDGDFWHGRTLERLKARQIGEFWINKLETNMARDKKYNRLLKKQGWKVLRLWETDIKKDSHKALLKIIKVLILWEQGSGKERETMAQRRISCLNVYMAKRMSTNTKNKTSRSPKTKKRLAIKHAAKAARVSKKK